MATPLEALAGTCDLGSLIGELALRYGGFDLIAHWTAIVGAELKSSLLHAADVVAFPSRVLPGGRTEGLPIALLEARLAGAPIVASDVGALREGLRPSDCAVPAEDVGALRQALEQRLSSRALRSHSTRVALVHPGSDEDATFTLAAAALRYRRVLTIAARSASSARRPTAMSPRFSSESAAP